MKRQMLQFFTGLLMFTACTTTVTTNETPAKSSGDLLLDKITLTLDNYDKGLKPGLPLSEIVKYDSGAKVDKDDSDKYQSPFENDEAVGYFFYAHRYTGSTPKISKLDEILMNFDYKETTDKATGKDIEIDCKPYADYITKRLGVSYHMGSKEEGEEDRYFWEKDGYIFRIFPDWDGLGFSIYTPEED